MTQQIKWNPYRMEQPPLNFKNLYVRDLAWLIASPPLMQVGDMFSGKYPKEWLEELDKNPTELVKIVSNNNRLTLGGYFECLFGFWMRNRLDTRLIAENLQVQSDSRTIGEFDFIIEENNRFYHIEATFKMYLGVEDSSEWSNWIGPRSKDRLDIKLEKMLGRQSELSKTPEGAKKLQELGVTGDVVPKIFCKGRFFYGSGADTPPKDAHNEHLRGNWLHSSDFECDSCIILGKPKNWLSPVNFIEKEQIITSNELKNITEPTLVAKIKDNRETERYFIMPDGWNIPAS